MATLADCYANLGATAQQQYGLYAYGGNVSITTDNSVASGWLGSTAGGLIGGWDIAKLYNNAPQETAKPASKRPILESLRSEIKSWCGNVLEDL